MIERLLLANGSYNLKATQMLFILTSTQSIDLSRSKSQSRCVMAIRFTESKTFSVEDSHKFRVIGFEQGSLQWMINVKTISYKMILSAANLSYYH
jgi:hypothetical protein